MSNKLQKKSNHQDNKSVSKKIDLSKINIKTLTKSLDGITIPRLFYQLVVFILDGSGSMTWEGITGLPKGQEINDQIIPIIERLNDSKNKNSFDVSLYCFSSTYNEVINSAPVAEIAKGSMDFNPCNYVENELTTIAPTLASVEAHVNEYLRKHHDKNSQALILILSDGALHDLSKALEITNRLKANTKVTISSYLFEDKNWKESLSTEQLEELRISLRDLSSWSNEKPLEFFNSTVDPDEIRKHMIKSISTVSKID